ncbi:MAG: hypothetical protein ABIP49_00310 [Lysobacterales bacterium]
MAANPCFLPVPGRTLVYREGNEEITVADETREIPGVATRVVHDAVKLDG